MTISDKRQRRDDDTQLQRPSPRAARAIAEVLRTTAEGRRDARSTRRCSLVRPIDHGGPALYPTPRTVSTTSGFSGILLDLGAQTLNVDVDQTGVGGVAVTPHLLEQDLTGEDLARLARQGDQEVELERGQRDQLVVAGDLVRGHVDDDVGDREQLGRLVLGPAQPCPHASDELLRLERLDDVVVGAGFEAENHVDGVRLRGQHHDRHTGIGTQNPAHVDAVHAGQHQVEQHQVRAGLSDRGERLGAVPHHNGLETFPAQDDREHLRECRVVVDNQNPWLHVSIVVISRP